MLALGDDVVGAGAELGAGMSADICAGLIRPPPFATVPLFGVLALLFEEFCVLTSAPPTEQDPLQRDER